MNKFLLILILPLILFSCVNDEETPTEPKGWSYAGLSLNRMQEYKITEIRFNAFDIKYDFDTTLTDTTVKYITGVDTSTYFVKDTIVNLIEDLEGDSVYVIHRYISDKQNEYKITPDSVWSAKFKNNLYLRTENNTKYSKLSFPITKGKLWDVNAYNGKESDVVEYTEIRVNKTVESEFFPDVIIVEHENNYDSTELKSIIHSYSEGGLPTNKMLISTEMFANGFGLITSNYVNLTNYQLDSTFASFDYFIIESGIIKTQKIIAFK